MSTSKRLTTIFHTAILTALILLTTTGCTILSEEQYADFQETKERFVTWMTTEIEFGKDKHTKDTQGKGAESDSEEAKGGAQQIDALSLGEPVYSSSIKDTNPDYMLPYEHYDADSFYDSCDEVLALAQAGKNRKAFKLFDELWEEINYISSQDTIASILYMENASDVQLQEEADYMDALYTEAYDRISLLGHELAIGSSAKAFKIHAGFDSFQYYLEYEPMSEEEKDLTLRETQLTNQYYEVMDGIYELSYTYEDQTYTLEQIYDEETMDAMDYDTWYAVYEGCLGKLCQEAGPIYTELVQVRTQLAELYGYDSYDEYADQSLYSRDYTPEELKGLKAVAKAVQMDYLQYTDVHYNLTPNDGNLTVLLAQLQTVADQCSPYASEACKFLCENKLYSLGAEENRFDQGYTTNVYQPQIVPFIYYKLYLSTYDLGALVHELGHFTDTYEDTTYAFLTESLDLAEVQSAGLQMLAAEKYSCCLDEKEAALLTASQLVELIDSVVTGCLYDDWQRAVYADPDMSLEDMCSLYKETMLDYGGDDYPGVQYEWILTPHNFNLPMYYISYATSAVEALQLWQLAEDDFDTAASIWENLIDIPEEVSFQEAMEQAGLETFANTTLVEELLDDALRAIKKGAR